MQMKSSVCLLGINDVAAAGRRGDELSTAPSICVAHALYLRAMIIYFLWIFLCGQR